MTAKTALPRVAALIGPFASGKTSLLEALLFATSAIPRKGAVKDGSSVGDATPEARQRGMSVEVNIATTQYLDDRWTFLDCPGSIEFQQDSYNALLVADAAVVVVEPEPARAVMVAPLLKFLDRNAIPHLLFINKVEGADARLRETLEALQAISDRPLVLREVPIREAGAVTGFIDLVSERAYKYREGQPSELIKLPDAMAEDQDEQAARQDLLEHLADLDDTLLEELLSDTQPASAEVYENLARDLSADLLVPVFFGSATHSHGIQRLLKALRHEVPGPADSRWRHGVLPEGGPLAQVFKTIHASHTGKLSFARIWRGEFAEAAPVNGVRPSGLFQPLGSQLSKLAKAVAGDVVAFGRLEPINTGDLLGTPDPDTAPWPAPLPPLFSLAVRTDKKQDEVKLTAAIAKMCEEDPSLSLQQQADTNEIVLWGQGEIHLLVALEKLKSRFNLTVTGTKPQVPYKESIRKAVSEHGRHKRQSGGHGQFGDVHIDIVPLPRGAGFQFGDTITGGVVPKQYIPAVEEGVREVLPRGPLGFPVVDLRVTLTDGSYHAVDSSDMAFKTAGRIAMVEALPKCDPVLLEPILSVEIAVPNEFTPKAQRIISSRRGQILGYQAKDGWKSWDAVQAFLPQAEMGDLIVELRSLTMGVGTFLWQFDHLQDVSGRTADKVVEDRKASLAAQ